MTRHRRMDRYTPHQRRRRWDRIPATTYLIEFGVWGLYITILTTIVFFGR